MKPYLRILAVALLAGCILDEAWEDTLTLTTTQPGLVGTIATDISLEGNSSGCAISAERDLHGAFAGPGQYTFDVFTESEQARSLLFVSVSCETASGGEGRTLEFTFGPSEPRVIVLPDPAIPGCIDPNTQ